MKVSIHSPEVSTLRRLVESEIGFSLKTPKHFSILAHRIEAALNDYLSDTTLQRVWLYKSGYSVVSIHTLDILSRFACGMNWDGFCRKLVLERVGKRGAPSGERTATDDNADSTEGFVKQQTSPTPSLWDCIEAGSTVRIQWTCGTIALYSFGEGKFSMLECRGQKSLEIIEKL